MQFSFDGYPALRRLLWRTGRKFYAVARGETVNDINANGETYVQACVVQGLTSRATPRHFFDVGANAGEWARRLLAQLPVDAVPRTNVWMFEPVPTTYAKLLAIVPTLPNSACVHVINFGLSDEKGTAEMAVLSSTGGTNTLHFDQRLKSTAHGLASVSIETLEGFCSKQNIEHINLFKCDTEGNDAKVLRGGLSLFKAESIDVAQFEYNAHWIYAKSYLKDVFDMLEGLPYRIGRICPQHIELFDTWHFELERFFEANYVVIHERALDWFEVKHGKFDDSNTYA